MQVYDGMKLMDVVSKVDNFLVMVVDIVVYIVIMDGLCMLILDVLVFFEEDFFGWEVCQYWQCYWLVDLLDGIKEFIKCNGEFIVNIVFIDYGKLILGVVYVLVMNVMYSVVEGKVWKEECGVCKQIQVCDVCLLLVVISCFYVDVELKEYL